MLYYHKQENCHEKRTKMNTTLIISQIIGIAAVATFLLSYQQKQRKNIIICNAVSRCLYIIQYLLLGAISGAVLDVLGAISSVVASKKDNAFIQKHLKAIFITTNALLIAAGVTIAVINRSLLDILPLIGVLLHTGAFWLSDERIIRRVSLAGSPFWLVYNTASRAYGSALGDILTMVSIVIAMIKFRKKPSEENCITKESKTPN